MPEITIVIWRDSGGRQLNKLFAPAAPPPPSLPPKEIILLYIALNLVMNYAASLLKCKDHNFFFFLIFSFTVVTGADGSDCDT